MSSSPQVVRRHRLLLPQPPHAREQGPPGGHKAENIVWSDSLLSTKERSILIGSKGATIWLTGLSGSGKSTIGALLEKRLIEYGLLAYRLDGDNVRFGLNKDLGFSEEDRFENIRRIGEVVSKLFTDCGIITICSFISPYRSDRDDVRKIFERDELPFFEVVYVRVPLEVAESRDPKGLYKKARSGKIKGFTGIDAPYEEPEHAELVLETFVDIALGSSLKCLHAVGAKLRMRA
ncbi:hypothetical protein GUITHDRAFT_65136 [Guillardia theta CCMP2712]|uniref:Adenylyl-sulfate kinase n=1 Tax=Guillardia theta (strain CCMP2712) TaxID=905079 RepID=L1JW58_GUITC|nr:hypothetical protein GUITHDRAFT_65136 [Guillardia theta CCMP2712]EKX52440.1 hypothetical protein GUITHDRAFT_65136 [Guillardia theta CCMP2712]|eukprot:XP_005839420.1 hypothetical protein GUITHDRAFT_65136 [Guillardia theta CCMP2712]